MDYHGVAVTDKTYQDLIRNRSVPTEFVLEIGAPVKRFIDASSEVCELSFFTLETFQVVFLTVVVLHPFNGSSIYFMFNILYVTYV